jgi:hypothetical protein
VREDIQSAKEKESPSKGKLSCSTSACVLNEKSEATTIVPKNLAFYETGFMELPAGRKAAVGTIMIPPDVAPVGCTCRHLLKVAETSRCECWKKLSQQSQGASYSARRA